MDKSLSQRHLLFLSVGVFIIGIVIIIIAAIFNASRVTLTVYTSPIKATVTVNNKTHINKQTGSTYSLPEGEYEVVVSRDGFESNTTKITVKKGEDEPVLKIALTAVSDEAKALLETEDEAYNREFIVTSSAIEKSEEKMESNPILLELPYYDTYFSVSQGVSEKNPSDASAFALYVRVYDRYKNRGESAFLSYMNSKGYSVDDYEIIYITIPYETRNTDTYRPPTGD